jgi:hypothetical protein
VKVAGAQSFVLNSLNIMRMGRLFEIYPDVDRARLAFRPKNS